MKLCLLKGPLLASKYSHRPGVVLTFLSQRNKLSFSRIYLLIALPIYCKFLYLNKIYQASKDTAEALLSALLSLVKKQWIIVHQLTRFEARATLWKLTSDCDQ
jgi:hypothetical protein